MTKVVLHGELGKIFGEVWNLAVNSPTEALRAIEANTRKLFKYLRKHDDGYAEYRVLIDDKDFTDVSELAVPFRKSIKTIHFVPVPKGGDNNQGLWMTVIGVVLVAIAVVVSWGAAGGLVAGLSALSGIGSAGAGIAIPALATLAFTTGIALTLGGIASLLTPVPDSASNEQPKNQPSYLFRGAVNTYTQGNPVPVLYGKMIVGSQVISVGITASDLPTLTKWNATVTYVQGAQVQVTRASGTRYYESKIDANFNHIPPIFPILEDGFWLDVTPQNI